MYDCGIVPYWLNCGAYQEDPNNSNGPRMRNLDLIRALECSSGRVSRHNYIDTDTQPSLVPIVIRRGLWRVVPHPLFPSPHRTTSAASTMARTSHPTVRLSRPRQNQRASNRLLGIPLATDASSGHSSSSRHRPLSPSCTGPNGPIVCERLNMRAQRPVTDDVHVERSMYTYLEEPSTAITSIL